MTTIQNIQALEILDSRGNPTVWAEITLSNKHTVSASVPSGASTGEHEAHELRDNDSRRYLGKGVLKACENINTEIRDLLLDQDPSDQVKIDNDLISLDGTENKARLGANAILAASIACAKAGAYIAKKPLYAYLKNQNKFDLPCPMMNIINGGAHANNSLDFQEFMIRPISAPNLRESIRFGCEIFHQLKALLRTKGHITAVGDEGGFAPDLRSNEEAFDIILEAIEKAGLTPGKDISLALDCAASEFYDKGLRKYIEKKKKIKKQEFASRSSEEQVNYLASLCKQYPVDSIEDALDENDWEGWRTLTQVLGEKIQLVGDDLFVTNPKFLKKGIEQKVANAILIKPNQIGSVTETLNTIKLAQEHNYQTVISHRSGETEDNFIADLAVATCAGQIKTGSLSRSDRCSKYNRLMVIENQLQKQATFSPKSFISVT
ncbi:MAG: phosphopyruvate hydratase [Chlamydiales bacterium]|nr:phosphopyruvate hydratase [Chlamydiales bacterium]